MMDFDCFAKIEVLHSSKPKSYKLALEVSLLNLSENLLIGRLARNHVQYHQ